MNPLRVVAVFRRIVAQFRRDPRTVALLYLAPLAIIALLAWVLSSQQSGTANVAIVNESTSPVGLIASKLQSALSQQTGISVQPWTTDESAARQMLKDNKVDLVVILPPDFSVENPKIELLTLGLNPAGEASRTLPVRISRWQARHCSLVAVPAAGLKCSLCQRAA